MITYEATIVCDHLDCPERIAGEVMETPASARAAARLAAVSADWSFIDARVFCPDHAAHHGRRAAFLTTAH